MFKNGLQMVDIVAAQGHANISLPPIHTHTGAFVFILACIISTCTEFANHHQSIITLHAQSISINHPQSMSYVYA
jgi:hypothetical protein